MKPDFNLKTKEILRLRAANHCSSPTCRRPTSGPADSHDKSINLGVAAHICGARPKSARYDPMMTDDERASIKNGIWLCQSCSVLIDRDEHQFPKIILHKWKKEHENWAQCNINSSIDFREQFELINEQYTAFPNWDEFKLIYKELVNNENLIHESILKFFDPYIHNIRYIIENNEKLLFMEYLSGLSRLYNKISKLNTDWRDEVLNVIYSLVLATGMYTLQKRNWSFLKYLFETDVRGINRSYPLIYHPEFSHRYSLTQLSNDLLNRVNDANDNWRFDDEDEIIESFVQFNFLCGFYYWEKKRNVEILPEFYRFYASRLLILFEQLFIKENTDLFQYLFDTTKIKLIQEHIIEYLYESKVRLISWSRLVINFTIGDFPHEISDKITQLQRNPL